MPNFEIYLQLKSGEVRVGPYTKNNCEREKSAGHFTRFIASNAGIALF